MHQLLKKPYLVFIILNRSNFKSNKNKVIFFDFFVEAKVYTLASYL